MGLDRLDIQSTVARVDRSGFRVPGSGFRVEQGQRILLDVQGAVLALVVQQ